MKKNILNYLERLGLHKNFHIIPSNTRIENLKTLENLTYQKYYSSLLILFDLSIPNHKVFVGTLSKNGFLLRKCFKKRLIFFNCGYYKCNIKIKGNFIDSSDRSKLQLEINGMRILPFLVRVVISIFFGIMILLFLLEVILEGSLPNAKELQPFFFLIFMFAIFIVLPFYLGRQHVKSIKIELEQLL